MSTILGEGEGPWSFCITSKYGSRRSFFERQKQPLNVLIFANTSNVQGGSERGRCLRDAPDEERSIPRHPSSRVHFCREFQTLIGKLFEMK